MSATEEPDRDEVFCEELVSRGWATREQVDEARRLKVAADELGQPTGIDAILLRKGFVPQDRLTVARRDVAAKLGQSLRIGKYEILQRLGQGGSGIVYRAFQTTLNREVALKVLTQRREGEEEYIDRFLREAKVAVTLNHVNVVRGLDFGHADGYHYFAMELVDGDSLFSLIKKEGRLSEGRALDVALQMVRALEHASTFRIVHRDIKPENILITKSGTAKLCDLGLARPVIEGGAAAAGGRPMGTALYVAPEQIRHESNLDFRADIYSLGATLYHALTGSPPFAGSTVTEIIKAHLSAPVPNPRERVLEVSTGAASIVMKMLAKTAAERYQALEALAQDLESVLDGRPPVNTITIGRKAVGLDSGAGSRGAERKSGSKAVVPAVVITSVAAIAAVGWYLFGREKPAAPPGPGPGPVLPGPKEDSKFDAVRIQRAREEDGAKAMQSAEGFEAEKGAGSAEAEARYREVAAAHEGTSGGRLAKSKAEAIARARADRIGGDLKQRSEASAKALAEGRLRDAAAAWAGLPAEVAEAGGRDQAAAALAKVEEAARGILAGAKALAAKAAAGDEGALAPARRGLEEAAASGVEAVAAEAAKERAALDAAVESRASRLRAAEEAWPRVCAEALSASAKGQKDAAAVLDGNAELLAPLAARVASLRAILDDAASFAVSIRNGFAKAAAAGESLRLRVPGRPGGAVSGKASAVRPDGFEIQRGPAVEVVAMREVAAEDLAGLAWKSVGAGAAADHRGAAAFFLARGEFALAEAEAKALEVLAAKDDAAGVRALAGAARAAALARSEAALREAELLRLQKKPAEARAALERAVALCPDSALAQWRLGAFLLENGKDADAAKALEAAALLSPAEPEAWYWIGEGRRRAGRVEDALTALDRFLGAAAADHPMREGARKSLEDLRTAASATAAKQSREDAARAYRKEEFAAAEELWRKVLRFNPDDTEGIYFLGKSLLALDRKVEGYSQLRRFLNLEKKAGSRVDDARRVVKDLEQRLGDSPAAARKAAEATASLDAGKVSDALEALGAAVALAPLRADTYVERARALQYAWVADARRDFLNQAVQDLETALLINEKHGRAWSMLAVTRFNLEEWEKSADASAKGVALDAGWTPIWEYRARACNRIGRYAQAEQAASEALAKEPRGVLHIAHAEALCGLGKIAEARRALDTAAEKFSLTAAERTYRADVLAKVLEAEKGK